MLSRSNTKKIRRNTCTEETPSNQGNKVRRIYIYIIHSSYLFSLAKKIVFSSPTAVTLFVFFVYGLCDDRTEEAHRHIKANNDVLAVQRSLIVVRPNS